jgi:hypothetical protein
VRCGLDLSGSVCLCEHGNESLGSIKGREFLNHMNDYHLFEEDSSLWSWLLHDALSVLNDNYNILHFIIWIYIAAMQFTSISPPPPPFFCNCILWE